MPVVGGVGHGLGADWAHPVAGKRWKFNVILTGMGCLPQVNSTRGKDRPVEMVSKAHLWLREHFVLHLSYDTFERAPYGPAKWSRAPPKPRPRWLILTPGQTKASAIVCPWLLRHKGNRILAHESFTGTSPGAEKEGNDTPKKKKKKFRLLPQSRDAGLLGRWQGRLTTD